MRQFEDFPLIARLQMTDETEPNLLRLVWILVQTICQAGVSVGQDWLASLEGSAEAGTRLGLNLKNIEGKKVKK